ncbi:MAG: hypothetical protein A2355_06690 [Spirochaetes bacterium RIFOXYB1_FULL_32_8]|nr:MAG: hypothetical protein A2355_06690 [Spirochaetes bacterium RIFOXYB1_FULL_32_8]HBD93210.1 hypothetical protein [Spirochaetia bacterium]HBI39285.1 hypothetical protein [Spirochaetia bacterium]
MIRKSIGLFTVLLFLSCSMNETDNKTNQNESVAVSTPTFSKIAGQYFGEQSIEITTETTGASIRYTVDGSEPTETAGLMYEGAVKVSNSMTVKAIAYKNGMTRSTVNTVVYNIIIWKGALTVHPENPVGGWAYYNSVEGISYIYDGTAWQVLAKDGQSGTDGQNGSNGATGVDGINGVSVVWKGSFISHLTSPELNWAYYNSVDGISYIYDGSSWQILAKDGKSATAIDITSVKTITIETPGTLGGLIEGMTEKNLVIESADGVRLNISDINNIYKAIILNSLISVNMKNVIYDTGITYFYFPSNHTLESIILPDQTTSLDKGTFNDNFAMKSIVFSDLLTEILYGAISNCYSLSSLTIPSKVISIEGMAFYGCSSLNLLIVNPVIPPVIESNSFFNCYIKEIKVPSNSVDAYKSATGWSDYASIIVSQ